MKKVFYFILSLFIFFACSNDDEVEAPQIHVSKLVGQWVYDHPEEGIWEVQKFVKSGVFYYSNKVTGNEWKFSNEMNNGRYWIEGDNRVTCRYVENDITRKLQFQIQEISDYSYTAAYNDGAQLGTFTYARLLDKKVIKPGEKYMPDYNKLVKVEILGYKSHKPEIVKVNSSTGEIEAVDFGHTYIDVITAEGTAVIEITVFDNDNFFEDYSFAFGKTIEEIVKVKGEKYDYRDDENGLCYAVENLLTDSVWYITGLYDKTHVEFVELILNHNRTPEEINAHLSDKYKLFSSEGRVSAYVTDKMIDGFPVGVIYDSQYRSDSKRTKLSFLVLKPTDEKWTDFTFLFGMDKDGVAQHMKVMEYPFILSDFSYSKDGSDYYGITDSDEAEMVGFVFNSDKKMCEFWVYLKQNFGTRLEGIVQWLKSKYIQAESECTERQLVFYNKSKRIRIVFDGSGYVSYTDNEQKRHTTP